MTVLKLTELYTLKWWILWYVNSILEKAKEHYKPIDGGEVAMHPRRVLFNRLSKAEGKSHGVKHFPKEMHFCCSIFIHSFNSHWAPVMSKNQGSFGFHLPVVS